MSQLKKNNQNILNTKKYIQKIHFRVYIPEILTSEKCIKEIQKVLQTDRNKSKISSIWYQTASPVFINIQITN